MNRDMFNILLIFAIAFYYHGFQGIFDLVIIVLSILCLTAYITITLFKKDLVSFVFQLLKKYYKEKRY